MAIELMAEVPKLKLKPYQKHVLLCLADHASREQGIAWPSQGRIAWETGYTRQRIITILRQLEDLGIIKEIDHPAKNIPCKTFLLKLDSAPRQEQYHSVKRFDTCKKILQGVSKDFTSGCKKILPEPSLEPLIESLPSAEEEASSAPGGKAPPDPPKSKRRSKKNGTDPRVQPLLETFAELIGYPLPNYGQEGTAAKKLLKDYEPAEILACWEYMQKDNDFWKGKHCGLASVNKAIGPWLKTRKHTGPTSNSGKIASA